MALTWHRGPGFLRQNKYYLNFLSLSKYVRATSDMVKF
ncbi:hypothetical protein D1AOALGA4SA_6585 [Olavius algarvensis Delta 1 endosymbiont]|nr:hypothetical protein D1AOALGA4SA_6585 [Olavius algarvensis Delta 1 endosymbiont]